MVWYEAQLVRERINNLLATEVVLMHSAMVAVISPKGEGNKSMQKLIKRLTDGN